MEDFQTGNGNKIQGHRLYCPFSDTEIVKKLGALWDSQKKVWFVPVKKMNDSTSFVPWLKPIFLNSKFSEKDTVKALGAIWDAGTRKWTVPAYKDSMTKFAKWMNANDLERCASMTKPQLSSPARKKRKYRNGGRPGQAWGDAYGSYFVCATCGREDVASDAEENSDGELVCGAPLGYCD